MEVILANTCESFTGSIDRSLGYSIQRRKDGFFAKRHSKGYVPPDGHWRFIVACAELVGAQLYFSDIRVPGWEIFKALEEAGFNTDNFTGSVSTLYSAHDVLAFANQFRLP